ncbi:MAG TPA: Fic family protein [Dehalococcoidia bacterium]
MAEGDGRQVEWLEALVDMIRELHDAIIKLSGGALGERPSLHGAVARPFLSAFGEDVYPTACEKAAALFHGIICDHAFTDGNKRTATVSAVGLLIALGALPQQPSNLQIRMLGQVALEAASGNVDVGAVTFWMHRIFDAEEQQNQEDAT